MTDTPRCLVCAPQIAPGEATGLCALHRRVRYFLSLNYTWIRLQLAVAHGTRTDWSMGQSHTERQCVANHEPLPWRPKFDDIMRRAYYWLDESGSEAA